MQIRVSDLLGRALGKMDVTIESAMRAVDGLTIMSNTKMAENKSDHTVYEVDMMKAKPARGFYDLTVNAGKFAVHLDEYIRNFLVGINLEVSKLYFIMKILAIFLSVISSEKIG